MTAEAVLVARQAIYDVHLNVVGYEILYRTLGADRALINDGDTATATVSVNALLDLGLDNLIGGTRAFVNVTRSVLLQGLYEFLPPERVVLELLEDVNGDEPVCRALAAARRRGYHIALDDFVLGRGDARLLEFADIVKVDLPALVNGNLEHHSRALARPGLQVLAEKVETHEQFERCKAAGFGLFQGFFLARPQLVQGRRTPADRASLVRLLARLQDADVEVDEIESLVASNVGLAFKLLRYVNSALHGVSTRVESIRHAIVMLGVNRVRSCVMMLVLAGLDDKPHELVVTALVRARYCQLLAALLRREGEHKYFTVGLLSMLDAFLDRPLPELLPELSMSTELEAALLRQEGPLGEVLGAAIACERADWQRLVDTGIDAIALRTAYVESLSWVSATDAVIANAASG